MKIKKGHVLAINLKTPQTINCMTQFGAVEMLVSEYTSDKTLQPSHPKVINLFFIILKI